MPRKEPKIRTVSYVHVGDKLVCTDDLDPERKRQLATWLTCTFLNAVNGGRARFYPVEEGEQEKCLSEKEQPAGAQKSPRRVGGPARGG